MPGEGWVGIAPDGVDCGILAGRGMGLGLRRIIGAARDGTGLTACRARDGVDCGILKLGWVGMVAYAFAAAAPDSDRARGWD